MGCNTSKEAMQAAADNAGAAEQKSNSSKEVKEIKSVVEDAGLMPEEVVSNSATESGKPQTAEAAVVDVKKEINSIDLVEEPEVAVVEIKEKIDLGDQVDKGKEAIKKIVKQEVTDIDLTDPEANRAATKIQAAFRGHQTRKSMKQGDAESKPSLKEEFSPDNKELCEAATKIQASFRGHLVRKSAPRKDEEEELSKELEKLDAKAPDEELDIDLNDPDLQMAATKIQASFRGHRVRKEQQSGSNE